MHLRHQRAAEMKDQSPALPLHPGCLPDSLWCLTSAKMLRLQPWETRQLYQQIWFPLKMGGEGGVEGVWVCAGVLCILGVADVPPCVWRALKFLPLQKLVFLLLCIVICVPPECCCFPCFSSSKGLKQSTSVLQVTLHRKCMKMHKLKDLWV